MRGGKKTTRILKGTAAKNLMAPLWEKVVLRGRCRTMSRGFFAAVRGFVLKGLYIFIIAPVSSLSSLFVHGH